MLCTEMIEMLAGEGISMARLNTCHGPHKWHRAVIGRSAR